MAFLIENQNDLANSSGYYRNKNKIKYRSILIFFLSSTWMNVYQGNPYFLMFLGNPFMAIHFFANDTFTVDVFVSSPEFAN